MDLLGLGKLGINNYGKGGWELLIFSVCKQEEMKKGRGCRVF